MRRRITLGLALTALVGLLCTSAGAVTLYPPDPGFELLTTWHNYTGTATSVADLKDSGTCDQVSQTGLRDSSKTWTADQFKSQGLYKEFWLKVVATGSGSPVTKWYQIRGNTEGTPPPPTTATINVYDTYDLIADGVQPGDSYEVWHYVHRVCDSTHDFANPEYYILEMLTGAKAGSKYRLGEGWSMTANCLTTLANIKRDGVAVGDRFYVGYDALENWPAYSGTGYHTDMNWHTWVQGGIDPYNEPNGLGGEGCIGVFHQEQDWKACRYNTISGLTTDKDWYAVAWASTHSLKVDVGYPPIRNLYAMIGVDVSGGTNPTSSGVVWGETRSDPGGEWRQVYVKFRPTSSTATIFLQADARTQGVYTQNVIGFDQVEVNDVGPPLEFVQDPTAVITDGKDSEATILWTTNLGCQFAYVYKRIKGAGSWDAPVVKVESDLTAHSVQLTGLQNSTTYEFYVKSQKTTAPAQTKTSGVREFTMPITFSGFKIKPGPNAASMRLQFTTDAAVKCSVKYGTSIPYGSQTATESEAVTFHDITLTGLTDGFVLYNAQAVADAQGNYRAAASANQTFHSLPSPSPGNALANGSFELTGPDQGVTLTDLDKNLYPNTLTYGGNSTEPRFYPWIYYRIDPRDFPPGCNMLTCLDMSQHCWCEGVDIGGMNGIAGPFPSGGQNKWWGGDNLQAQDGSYFLVDTTGWSYHNGGVFQRITYPNDTDILLQVKSYVRQDPAPTLGHIDDNNYIGIDPTGGIDPMSPNVIWQPYYLPQGQWANIGLTGHSGNNGVITVFLHAQERWALGFHGHAFDDARVGLPQPYASVAEVKQLPIGSGVILGSTTGKIVTKKLGSDKIYIQDDDRSAGIGVLGVTAISANRKDRVKVSGIMDSVNGEVVINKANVTKTGTANDPVPLGENNVSVGGGAVGTLQPAVTDRGYGVSPSGLLCTVWGRVLPVPGQPDRAEYSPGVTPGTPDYDPYGRYHMYIDDGSNITADFILAYDGVNKVWQNLGDYIGVKVYYDVVEPCYHAYPGDWVVCTGIAGIELSDSNYTDPGGTLRYIRTLTVRENSDEGSVQSPWRFKDIIAWY